MSGAAWIAVVARNNLQLLQAAVRSFKAQDCRAWAPHILVVNNGSSDNTPHWLRTAGVDQISNYPQHGVAHAWNQALRYIFSLTGSRATDRVLVCNQDVVLRPDTYRWLEAEQAAFVTAVGSHDEAQIKPHDAEGHCYSPDPHKRRPHPDFSCFMISRECYELVGAFDEQFIGAYCEDGDYHLRMHDAGIEAYAIDLPFWHVAGGAQTLKRANENEAARIHKAAAANRRYFAEKWGFTMGSDEYYAAFGQSPDAPSRPA